MLFDLDGNLQAHIPHRVDYDRWRARLSDADHASIMEALHGIMNAAIERGEDRNENGIFNSSYIPGADWRGTPYQPIYVACGENFDHARFFYGLLVWEAVMNHGEEWVFIRQEIDSDRPLGLTYFHQDP